jgi:hypothetical protein
MGTLAHVQPPLDASRLCTSSSSSLATATPWCTTAATAASASSTAGSHAYNHRLQHSCIDAQGGGKLFSLTARPTLLARILREHAQLLCVELLVLHLEGVAATVLLLYLHRLLLLQAHGLLL